MMLTACSAASTASAQITAAPRFIVSTVETFLGWPYRLGGDSPRGLDCSALVQRAFRTAGVELPRTAAEQFRKGCAVAAEELAAGDLVFFHEPRRHRISHVGVYIGGARFIHAGRHGVLVASLHAAHWARRFAGARRMIEIAPETDFCLERE
jgi:cell wall-associated NlpC family hydrolase